MNISTVKAMLERATEDECIRVIIEAFNELSTEGIDHVAEGLVAEHRGIADTLADRLNEVIREDDK